jgi:hypothetical protein
VELWIIGLCLKVELGGNMAYLESGVIYIYFFGLSFWWRSEMKIKEENKKYGFM